MSKRRQKTVSAFKLEENSAMPAGGVDRTDDVAFDPRMMSKRKHKMVAASNLEENSAMQAGDVDRNEDSVIDPRILEENLPMQAGDRDEDLAIDPSMMSKREQTTVSASSIEENSAMQ